MHTTMNRAEWLMLIALSILWGGSFFLVGVCVPTLPPLTLVAARVTVAALALTLILSLSGGSLPSDHRIWRCFFVMGLLNNIIPFMLIVWGQHHIASGLAAILNATTPFFTVLLCHCVTPDEKITRYKLIGIVLGIGGVVIMIGGKGGADLFGELLPQLAILLAAISYSCAGIYGRRFHKEGISPMTTATGQVICSSVVLIPSSLVLEAPYRLPIPGISVILAILGLGLLSTALAYILYFRILATAGATNVLLVTLLIPASSIVLGSLLLGEQLAGHHYGGLAFIDRATIFL